jgi:hypothetical protein
MFRLYLVSHLQAYAVTLTIKLGSAMAGGIPFAIALTSVKSCVVTACSTSIYFLNFVHAQDETNKKKNKKTQRKDNTCCRQDCSRLSLVSLSDV